MTDRYVGPGGSDGNSGLTWALRKETLNGVEDTPVVAGDTIYVGPGTYRETLVIDVDGSDGNLITYIGDVTGENTDGIGGIVRITGLSSDDSYPSVRATCLDLYAAGMYHTFSNFHLGELTGDTFSHAIRISGAFGYYITFRNIVIGESASSHSAGTSGVYYSGSEGPHDVYLYNCYIGAQSDIGIQLSSAINEMDPSFAQNIFFNGGYMAFIAAFQGGFDLLACSWVGQRYGAAASSLAGGQYIDILDSMFSIGQYGTFNSTGDLDEDYNLYNDVPDVYSNGVNSITSQIPKSLPILVSGYKFPWDIREPRPYNDNVYKSAISGITDDMYGLSRPGGDKFTRGAIQVKGVERDASEYRSSPSSMKMDDASKHIVSIPINDTRKIKVTVYVKREANYAGTNPQLILSLPTQVAATATDTGSTGAYNKLSVSVTPTANDRWLQIQLVSNNTAVAGSYTVWFDDLTIRTSPSVVPTMKWVTNEIPMFCFSLENVADPWITPNMPVPVFQGELRAHYPMPSMNLG